MPRLTPSRPLWDEYLGRPGTQLVPDDTRFRCRFTGVETVADLTVSLFGRRRYRKDFVKAVAGARADQLYLAWCLRGPGVPTDWLVDYLRAHDAIASVDDDQLFLGRNLYAVGGDSTLRRVLCEVEPRSVRRLLRERGTHPRLILDINRGSGARAARVTDPRSWADLHDRLSAQERAFWQAEEARDRARWAERLRLAEQDEQENAPARQARATELIARLAGAVADGVALSALTTPDELVRHGAMLRNCLADCQRDVSSHRSVIMAVLRDDGVVGALEVSLADPETPRLTQLLGRRNRTLPADVHDPVVAHLADAGVDTSGRYWGRRTA